MHPLLLEVYELVYVEVTGEYAVLYMDVRSCICEYVFVSASVPHRGQRLSGSRSEHDLIRSEVLG